MNTMKKIITLIAVCFFSGIAAVHAEDISLNDRFYISSPVITADGEVIRALRPGRTYSSVDISLSVEQKEIACVREALTVTAALYEGEALTAVDVSTQYTDSRITQFNLALKDTPPLDDSSKLKIFVWKDMEPYTAAVEIGASYSTLTAEQTDIEIIRKRIEQDSKLYSTTADPSSLLAKLNSDGKFNDIDYGYTSDKSTWPPSAVFSNALVMAQAYFSEGNSWYHNDELKAALDSVLNDWAENQYKSVNWWFNEIDVPKKLSQLLLYPFDENEPYLPVLEQLAMLGMPKMDESEPHKASDTGGNLTDKLQTAIKIAAATRNADAMKNTVSYLLDNELSVFDHANGGEGIMTDYTLHQHGSFFYDGSYGSVFCGGINKLLGYLSDTVFMVSDRALNTYADYILDGHSWFFKNAGSDFACFGRAISRKNGVGGSIKNDSLGAVNILTSVSGVERRAELLKLKSDRLGKTDNSTSAARHFYISDMTVMHRPDFYIGVRTSSKRNINTEYMNGENSRASFISDGATTVMKSGNEYKNIFAVWDWSLIPGTTTEYLNPVPAMSSTYQYGLCEFVGGVSDGENAVAVMDYKRCGVTAKKSYFLFDRGFTALGAGITGTSADIDVRTTMNQCIQNGLVTYNDGAEHTITSTNGTNADHVNWVLHDNAGYYFPYGEDVTVRAERRNGSWNAINTSQSSASVSENVFALYTSHGKQPVSDSYAYTVIPSVSKQELEEYAHNPSMKIVENTNAVQGVWSENDTTAGVVFWNKGVSSYYESITFPKEITGLEEDLVIEALRDPCVVMLKSTEKGFDLYVSNPKNNSLAQTMIGINRRLSGDAAVWDGKKTIVTVDLPQGNRRGSTVRLSLNK